MGFVYASTHVFDERSLKEVSSSAQKERGCQPNLMQQHQSVIVDHMAIMVLFTVSVRRMSIRPDFCA